MRSGVRNLLRRFATELISGHDVRVAYEIMTPGYTLHIGGHDLGNRDDGYLPAVCAQFDQVPDLALTVHDVLATQHGGAIAFTEHGTSTRHGRRAAWRGVALFAVRDGRLCEGWAEEDYLARRRQWDGEPEHGVDPAGPDPWSGPVHPCDQDAARVVRRWLEAGASPLELVGYDEFPPGDPDLAWGDTRGTLRRVDALVSGGDKVAFHATWSVTADAGHARATAELAAAGLLTVIDGRVVGGRVVRDRLGLQRALRDVPTEDPPASKR